MSNKTEVWKMASEVFADISELTPKQALAHLYGIKNITEDVRDAVITLINAGSQATEYFEQEIAANYSVAQINPKKFQSGMQLDEYELLEELGHGGMSQVFKAKRINIDQQTFVAIKIFAPRDKHKELLNHFINEQKILAGLSHPNIVKMYHGGTTGDDIAYLVMELIEDAQNLNSYCQSNSLNTNQKIKLIAQCANALSYSHANLIIHRDLKPDNILINQSKQLKIVDFGIAKLINKDATGNNTTIMALTPSYAAPEQINSQPISIKTDIFSLAVVALDLLTKNDCSPLPTDRMIKSCAGDEEYLDKVFKNLNCDKDLKNILNKALSQSPERRYSSMQSFADDLNNYTSNKPVNATSQSFLYRIKKFAKRRAALFATMVSFVAFMIIGSFIGYQQYKQIKIEAQKANQVKQFLLDAYAQTNPDYAKGNVITAEDILNYTANNLDKSSLDDEVKFELLQTIGIAYGQIGQPQKAADFLGKSLTIKEFNNKSIAFQAQNLNIAENWEELNRLFNSINIDTFSSSTSKAKLYRVLAKVQARESKFTEAIDNLNKAIVLNISNQNKTQEILSKRIMAEFLFLQSKPNEGITLLKNLLKDPELDQTSILGMGLRSDLSTLYTDIGELDKAQINWTDLIQDQREILGDFHPELAKSLIQFHGVYRYKGDMEKAKELVQEAHEIHLKVFGENNIRTATSFNSLAIMHYQTGNIPKAIELMYKAINIYQEKQSDDYAGTLELKTNLSALLIVSKRYKEGLVIAREVYTIQLKKLGEYHDSTIYSQQVLAKALVHLGQLEEAQQLAETAHSNAVKHLGLKNPLTVGTYFVLASVYSKQQKHTLAIEKFKEIINKEIISIKHPKYPELMKSLVDLYTNAANFEQAEIYHLKTIESFKSIYGDEDINTINAKKSYLEFLKLKL